MKFTEKQIEELKQIKYVKNATSKSIIFTLEAKKKALKMKEKFLTSKEIFQKLGFPEYILNSDIPKKSIYRWFRNKQIGSIEKKRGREKQEQIDFNNMTLEQENQYLKAKLTVFEELQKMLKSDFFP